MKIQIKRKALGVPTQNTKTKATKGKNKTGKRTNGDGFGH